jgi:hypothetical protein
MVSIRYFWLEAAFSWRKVMPADLVISTNRIGLRGDVAKDLFQLVANIAAAGPPVNPAA